MPPSYGELDNTAIALPSLNLTNIVDNRYFQYKAFFETDTATESPELTSIVIGPTHYDAGQPTVINGTGEDFTALNSFSETLGGNNEGTTQYQVSHNGTDWYYHDGSAWTVAVSFIESNTANAINAALSSFVTEIGTGTFYYKAFLNSDGTQQVEIDQVDLDFTLTVASGDDDDDDSTDDDDDDSGGESDDDDDSTGDDDDDSESGESGEEDSSTVTTVVADAGADQTIMTGQSFQLDGHGSTGNSLIYFWEILSGAGTLTDPNSATPTFYSEGSDSNQHVTIRLLVSDDSNEVSLDTVTIHVIGTTSDPLEIIPDRLVAWDNGFTFYEGVIVDNDGLERITLSTDNVTILLPAGLDFRGLPTVAKLPVASQNREAIEKIRPPRDGLHRSAVSSSRWATKKIEENCTDPDNH